MDAAYTALGSDSSDYMPALQVAAHMLVVDLSDVRVRGYLKEHPNLVEHRLALIEAMTRRVRAAVKKERADGQWSELDEDPAADHAEQVAEFNDHACDCPFCLNGE